MAEIDTCQEQGQDPLTSKAFRTFTKITQRLMYTADEIPLTKDRWQRWEAQSHAMMVR